MFERAGDRDNQKLKERLLIPTETDVVVEDSLVYPQLRDDSVKELELIAESKGIVPTKSHELNKTALDMLFSEKRKLFLVCFHLPIVVRRGSQPLTFEIEWAESLIAKTSNSIAEKFKTYWVGTVNVPGEPLTEVLLTIYTLLHSLSSPPQSINEFLII